MKIASSSVAVLAVSAALVTVPVTTASAAVVNANDPAAAECLAAGNVWVVVDKSDGKDALGDCAEKFTTGREALESTEFDINASDGQYGWFITGIEDVAPVWSEKEPYYWAFFPGTVAADGTVTYQYSDVGVSDYQPKPGSVLGMVGSDGKQQPRFTEVPDLPQQIPGDMTPPDTSALIGVVVALAIALITGVVGVGLAQLAAGGLQLPM